MLIYVRYCPICKRLGCTYICQYCYNERDVLVPLVSRFFEREEKDCPILNIPLSKISKKENVA